MIGSSTDYLLAHFERQFGFENGRLVYRRNNQGEAIPVSEVEREGFVAAYHRSIKRAFWYFRAILIASVLSLAAFAVALDADPDAIGSRAVLYATLLVITVAFVAYSLYLRNAPLRSFGNRAPVAPARSRREMRAITLDLVNYPQIVLGFAFAAYLAYRFRHDTGFNHWFFLTMAAVIAALLLILTIRKVLRGRPTP